MDPVVMRAVGTAGSALSKYAVRATLGSARQRALEGVYRRAIERAVNEVSADEGTTGLDLVHAVGLLERIVSAATEGDLPLLESEEVGNDVTMRRWREIATEQGLDTETFPLPFEKLVDRLLRSVAEEALRTAADGDGNPLFPPHTSRTCATACVRWPARSCRTARSAKRCGPHTMPAATATAHCSPPMCCWRCCTCPTTR